MAVTKDDLREFNRYADERLARGEASSIRDLADEWEATRREQEEAVADVRQSHADIDVGNMAAVDDTFADVRKQLGRR